MRKKAYLVLCGWLTGCTGGIDGSAELVGDTGDPGVFHGDGIGVTPGGAKDIGYARMAIQRGTVPAGKTITVEGLLSEHDIPTQGGDCQGLVCLRPSLGVAKALDTGRLEHFVQLGFLSGFRRSTFRRPPLDVVVLIDHSASMSGDMAETNAAVTSMIDKLRDDDRISVLAFNDRITTVAPLGPVGDRQALKKKVAAIRANGGWSFMPAVTEAYRVARQAEASSDRMRRVMVFSCGYPSVTSEPRDAMRTLVHAGAEERIGLSFFGVLLGWDRELADLLGRERGGAFYYLENLEKVVKVFDQDFDLMVTPVMYGLEVRVDPGAPFEVVKLYGMPGMGREASKQAPPRDPASGSTGGAFLSSNRGAIVARLRLKEGGLRGATVGTITLRYEPEPALGYGAGSVQQVVPIADAYGDDGGYDGTGVRKAVALVNQATQMIAACDAYHAGKAAAAAELLAKLRDHLRGEAEGMADEGLFREVALVDKLLAIVEKK